jgi:hypothetical protein
MLRSIRHVLSVSAFVSLSKISPDYERVYEPRMSEIDHLSLDCGTKSRYKVMLSCLDDSVPYCGILYSAA